MKVYRAPSSIHGIGLFAGEHINSGDIILLAITNNCNVLFNARYINHSIQPNTKLVRIKNDYYLVAIQPIYQHTEITNNYFFTPDCIMKPDISYAFSR
jgi:SET domain-containing protein